MGIKVWLRYRDDLFIICKESCWEPLFDGFYRVLAPVYRPTLEGLSKVSVTMLDTRVTAAFAGDLHVSPHFKSTAQNIPLVATSAHPPGVHKWPLGALQRLEDSSSTEKAFLKARDRLLEQFRTGGIQNEYLSFLSSSNPYRSKRLGSAIARSILDQRQSAPRGPVTRLVLRWHWKLGGLSQTIAAVRKRWASELRATGFASLMGLGIAWRNSGKAMRVLTRSE